MCRGRRPRWAKRGRRLGGPKSAGRPLAPAPPQRTTCGLRRGSLRHGRLGGSRRGCLELVGSSAAFRRSASRRVVTSALRSADASIAARCAATLASRCAALRLAPRLRLAFASDGRRPCARAPPRLAPLCRSRVRYAAPPPPSPAPAFAASSPRRPRLRLDVSSATAAFSFAWRRRRPGKRALWRA